MIFSSICGSESMVSQYHSDSCVILQSHRCSRSKNHRFQFEHVRYALPRREGSYYKLYSYDDTLSNFILGNCTMGSLIDVEGSASARTWNNADVYAKLTRSITLDQITIDCQTCIASRITNIFPFPIICFGQICSQLVLS